MTTDTLQIADRAIKVLDHAAEKLGQGAVAAQPFAELIIREYVWRNALMAILSVALLASTLVAVYKSSKWVYANTKGKKFYDVSEGYIVVIAVTTLLGIAGIISSIICGINSAIIAVSPHYSILKDLIER